MNLAVSGGAREAPILPQEPIGIHQQIPYGFYMYNDRFWSVPKNFVFPAMKMRLGWQCWLQGLPGNRTQVEGRVAPAPIIPFCRLKSNRLPLKASIAFRGTVAPIFVLMQQAPEFEKMEVYSQADLDVNFERGMEFVKSRVSYIFENNQRWKNYTVSTFCKKIKVSSIQKFGSEMDKSFIQLSRHNSARPGRRR